MSYTVYKHTSPSDKVYIGITCQKVKKRWGSGANYKQNKYFYSAIKKYSWSNFKHEILFDNLSKEEACQKEIELISTYKSTNREYGYNISTGGDVGTAGMHHSEETKEKMSKIRMGKCYLSDEAKKRIADANRGKHHSAETRKKLSQAHIGVQTRNKKVICVETGEVFCSILDAGKSKNISRSAIGNCLRGLSKKSGGYHWEYYQD